MPDWTLIIDNDGNRYYLDRNGNIRVPGKPEFDYKPVSSDGLEYYLNQGIELIKSHHKTEGLTLLKSILAMPSGNSIIYNAQKNASKEINKLIKNEGSRFEKLNNESSILLYKTNHHTLLINDNMKYSLKCPANISLYIISKRFRENKNYKYYGLLLGLILDNSNNKASVDNKISGFQDMEVTDKNKYSGYDLLIAIDSERFPHKIKKIKSIEDHWRKRLGHDTLERVLLNNTNNILYEYTDKRKPGYSGIEGFYKNNNKGYYLKAITSRNFYEENITVILELINNFQIN